jgi:phosphoribosyl 1,2-cyclic phosphodiesterase
VQGLRYFAPFFWPDQEVHVWGPASGHHGLGERLARLLSPPLSPVRLDDFACRLSLHDVPGEQFTVPGLDVAADLVTHPGPTLGYRLVASAGSMAYVPDHELAFGRRRSPGTPSIAAAHDLVERVDLLVHDAQYSSSEYPGHVGWGHSSMTEAIAFASGAEVGRLRTFHHDPEHDDDTIDRLVDDAVGSSPGTLDVAAAAEGRSVELVGSGPRTERVILGRGGAATAPTG